MIEQTPIVACFGLGRIAGRRMTLEMIRVGLGGRLVKQRPHLEQQAIGVTQGDIDGAAGEMRTRRVRVTAGQRDEFARTRQQLGLIKLGVMRLERLIQRLEQILLHPPGTPAIHHHQRQPLRQGARGLQQALIHRTPHQTFIDRPGDTEARVGGIDLQT